MKTLLMTFVVAASLIQAPASGAGNPAPAASPTADILAFCREFNVETGVSVGRCVGFARTDELGSAGFATHFCQAFEGGDPEDFYLIYDSLSDCIIQVHGA